MREGGGGGERRRCDGRRGEGVRERWGEKRGESVYVWREKNWWGKKILSLFCICR